MGVGVIKNRSNTFANRQYFDQGITVVDQVDLSGVVGIDYPPDSINLSDLSPTLRGLVTEHNTDDIMDATGLYPGKDLSYILTDFKTSLDGVVGALKYSGDWNAETNTPDLSSTTPLGGSYYIVSVAGDTDLDGETDWNVGDMVVYNSDSGSWDKYDNSNAWVPDPLPGIAGILYTGHARLANGTFSIGSNNSPYGGATEIGRLAVGKYVSISENYSAGVGTNLSIENSGSFSSGNQNVLEGVNSFASGLYNRAHDYCQSVFGYFAVEHLGNSDSASDSNHVFSVGIGTSTSNPKNALTILGSGNVGINEDSPTEKLHVHVASTNEGIGLTASSTTVQVAKIGNYQGSGETSGNFTLYRYLTNDTVVQNHLDLSPTYLNFRDDANSINKIRIDSNNVSYLNGGNVGINTSSPVEKLHVNGNIKYNGNLYNDGCTASGDNSASFGLSNTAYHYANTTIGHYAVIDDTSGSQTAIDNANTIFAVGNGADNDHRSNAMTVLASGNVGINTDIMQSWNTDYTILQLGANNALSGREDGVFNIWSAMHRKADSTYANLIDGKYANFIEVNNGDFKIFSGVTNTVGSDPNLGLRFICTQSGNVGINTSSPSSQLTIEHTSPSFRLTKTGVTHFIFDSPTDSILEIGGSSNSTLFIDVENIKLGIGISPSEKLQIHSSNNYSRTLYTNNTTGSGSTSGLLVGNSLNDAYVWNYASGKLSFATNNTARMTIDSSGNIGIGTNSITSARLLSQVSANDGYSFLGYNPSGYVIGGLYSNSSGEGVIYVNDGTGGSSSVKINSNGISYFNGGNVGIDTDSPKYGLQIKKGTYGLPATSGTTPVGNSLSVGQSGGDACLDFGVGMNGSSQVLSWLQSTNSNDYSNTYMLSLNPNGGNVGINTTTPASKLHVNGGIQCADDTDAASVDKVGTLRYKTSGNNSYVEMCMQTGTSTYAWLTILENNW